MKVWTCEQDRIVPGVSVVKVPHVGWCVVLGGDRGRAQPTARVRLDRHRPAAVSDGQVLNAGLTPLGKRGQKYALCASPDDDDGALIRVTAAPWAAGSIYSARSWVSPVWGAPQLVLGFLGDSLWALRPGDAVVAYGRVSRVIELIGNTPTVIDMPDWQEGRLRDWCALASDEERKAAIAQQYQWGQLGIAALIEASGRSGMNDTGRSGMNDTRVIPPWTKEPCSRCGCEFLAARGVQVTVAHDAEVVCVGCDMYEKGYRDGFRAGVEAADED